MKKREWLKVKKSIHVRVQENYMLLSVFILFHIVFNAMMAFRVSSIFDFPVHNRLALAILENDFEFWVLYWDIVAFVMLIFNSTVEVAAGAIVFVFRMAYVLAILYWVKCELGDKISDKAVLFIATTALIAASIPNIFGPHLMYYYGFGINVWHNPTTFTVLPFAVISFFLFCRVVTWCNMQKTDRLLSGCLLLTVAILFSAYAKISWIVAFAPAVLIYLFVWWATSKFNFNRFKDCLLVGVCFIPAGLFAIRSYFRYTAFPNVGYFTFGVFELVHYPSMLLNLSLPILVLALCYKQLKQNCLFQMAWLTYVIAAIQLLFTYDDGPARSHGNTGWGHVYALTILLLVSLIELIKYLKQSNLTRKQLWLARAGIGLAFVHMFSGIYYAYHIFVFSSFWF